MSNQKEDQMMVKADEYQLNKRHEGVYQDKPKNLTRGGMLLEKSFVESRNDSRGISGKMYVVDEKATEEYYEVRAEQLAVQEQRQLREKSGLGDLAEALIDKASEKKGGNAGTGGDDGGTQDPELIAKHIELFEKAPMANMKNANLKIKVDNEVKRLSDLEDK